MECERQLLHVSEMTFHQPTPDIDLHTPLGQKADDREQVDLLIEAGRLKFTDSEIAELKRLYGVSYPSLPAIMPQKTS